ncbi:MAG: T9SS type A sorting domain-containing protein [Chryseolinea sp.]
MKTLYVFIFLCSLVGSAIAQGPIGFESEQPERLDMKRGVTLFPNPTTDFISIRFEHINVGKMTVTMHNIIGNQISVSPEQIDDHELKIRVKDFDAGYYLLALKDEQSKFRGTYKFLKL